MDPAVERSSSTRSSDLYSDNPTQSSGDYEPAEVRAMLSELSGTSLPPGSAWDAEAMRRLEAFQRSENLPATGHLDTVTASRLRARFEQVSEGRHAEGAQPIRNASPTAAEQHQVESIVHSALHAMEHLATQFAADSPIREAYITEAREYSANLMRAFERGEISAGDAALIANKMRNSALVDARQGLSPAGAALSKFLKEEGLQLPALVEKYAGEMFGKAVRDLTAAERGAVCMKIAERAGVTRGWVNTLSKAAPTIGKVMLAVTVAVAVYQVATAEDKVREGVKQGASLVGFLAGAKAGAAIGGAGCALSGVAAPATPICSAIGGLVGGIVGMSAAEHVADYGYQRIKG